MGTCICVCPKWTQFCQRSTVQNGSAGEGPRVAILPCYIPWSLSPRHYSATAWWSRPSEGPLPSANQALMPTLSVIVRVPGHRRHWWCLGPSCILPKGSTMGCRRWERHFRREAMCPVFWRAVQGCEERTGPQMGLLHTLCHKLLPQLCPGPRKIQLL